MNIDWSAFQESFYDFLGHVTILSKDLGRVRLEMYDAQRYFFDEIFDGLRHDVHWFVIGKGRQLGITTGCLLLDIFYAGAIANVQAAVVFDSDGNKEKFRKLLGEMIDTLPRSHKLPIQQHNRQGITFKNGNMLDYLVAGTKRGAGNLGRSRALNYVHASECAYYGDADAFETFKDVLSELFPLRLYLFESTGNGYNLFYDLWEDAVADELTKRAIFVTWWRKRTYSYRRGTSLFRRYGWPELSKDEKEAAEEVRRLYGHAITMEQWSWYRHRSDPRAVGDHEEISEDERREVITQEHPHYPEQCFRGTGTPFIPSQYIAPALARAEKALFKAYMYYLGEDVTATKIEPTRFANKAHLKVWQEPDPNGVYVVSADTAYGASDEGDQFCAQVLRCYADRIVQVAEFCDRSVQPYQFAWVLLHLCGWYENCRWALELNGSGEAVMTEFRNLRTMLESGRLAPKRLDTASPTDEELENERSWRNMTAKVRQYLWHRADSLTGGGYNLQFKCLALDTYLPTPDERNWIAMGDIEVGDQLYDEAGEICRVTGVSEIKTGLPCFRITFEDGTSIVADADHEWPIVDLMWPVRTSELRPSVDKLPLAGVLQPGYRELPINPYVLGVWLGDGESAAGRYYAHRDDIEEMGENLRNSGAELSEWNQEKEKNTCYQTILGLKVKLRELGVLNNKHIPDVYLRAHVHERLSLLQGLMDTDGTITQTNGRQCAFVTSNWRLACGFAELLRTLGIKAKFLTKHPTLNYRGQSVECAEAYQFYFTAYDRPIFQLKRKLERQGRIIYSRGYVAGGLKKSQTHKILAVEPVDSVPVRCIQVDSPARLYLAGEAMVPTHNTTLETKFTIMTQLSDRFMLGQLEINSAPCLQEMRTLRKDGRSIQAETKKNDDRPVAMALGVRAYIDSERGALVATNRTFAVESAKTQEEGGSDLGVRFMNNMMRQAIADKARYRRDVIRRAKRQRWAW